MTPIDIVFITLITVCIITLVWLLTPHTLVKISKQKEIDTRKEINDKFSSSEPQEQAKIINNLLEGAKYQTLEILRYEYEWDINENF